MTTKRKQTRLRIQSVLDEYGALPTLAHEIELCDALADAAIDVLVKKPTPRKPKPKRDTGMYHLAVALAEVCRMGYDINKGRLFAEAKQLAKAEPTPTPALVREHYGNGGSWYKKDWRGMKNELPTPYKIRQTWLQLAVEETGTREFTV